LVSGGLSASASASVSVSTGRVGSWRGAGPSRSPAVLLHGGLRRGGVTAGLPSRWVSAAPAAIRSGTGSPEGRPLGRPLGLDVAEAVPASRPVSAVGTSVREVEEEEEEEGRERRAGGKGEEYTCRELTVEDEAVLVEAAWIRARAFYEFERSRFVEGLVKAYAEREVAAVMRRLRGEDPRFDACHCMVAVAADGSVVGTLDISVCRRLPNEALVGDLPVLPEAPAMPVPEPFFWVRNRTLQAPASSLIEADVLGYTGPLRAYIGNVCVAVPARRNGIGRKMLHHALAQLEASNVGHAYVHVAAGNSPAIAMYTAIGFVVEKEEEIPGGDDVENALLRSNRRILMRKTVSAGADR